MLNERSFILVLLSLAFASLPACGGGSSDDGDSPKETASGDEKDDGGATETNVAPAPCADSNECPEGVECVFENAGDEMGHCDVAETKVERGDSLGAPAPCAASSECPEGIECVFASADDRVGHCDVSETTVSDGGSGDSLGAPAPCDSTSDCPAGIECVKFDEVGPGYCNVNEHTAL